MLVALARLPGAHAQTQGLNAAAAGWIPIAFAPAASALSRIRR